MTSFHLSIWDYAVFAIVLLVSASIGIYFRLTGGKQKTIQEYLLADGQMSAIPVAFSLTASFISAITILGVSAEVYNYGTQFLLINIAHCVGTPIVCYVYIPVFCKLKIFSVYEYLERRFGKFTRIIASSAFIVQMVLYMGIVVYAPALALSAVTGFDKTLAILSVGTVCTFYSAIGGMKAVLFTDIFQALLMIAAVLAVVIQGLIEFGGVSGIWNVALEGRRIEFMKLSLDITERHTFCTQVIGGTFVFLSLYAVNQAQVQRLLSTRNLSTARRSLWYSLPILMVLSLSTGFAGLVIYARYKDCDPILDQRIHSSDQLLPLFVVDSFRHIPGLTGLFIAGILSGSLSTVSSAINSLAAVTIEDYIQPLIKSQNPSATTALLMTKAIAFVYGGVCVGLAFLAENFAGVLQTSLTIFGVVGGPLLGLFTAGMVFPFTSELTVVPAFTVALLFTSWMGFGRPKPVPVKLSLGEECNNFSSASEAPLSFLMDFYNQTNVNEDLSLQTNNTIINGHDEILAEYFYLYRISYQWYPLIGFTVTILISLILSAFIRRKEAVDTGLLTPMIAKIYMKSCENANE